MVAYLRRALALNTAIGMLFAIGWFVLLPSPPVDADAVWKKHYTSKVLYDYRDVCWQGPAPQDAPSVPGHVILRVEGSPTHEGWFYGGKDYVRIALADVFTKDNPKVKVGAFCY